MAKKISGTQIEMLLPISGKRTIVATTAKKTSKSLTYEKVVESLRKKGLTKAVGHK
jgi:predicted GTPase